MDIPYKEILMVLVSGLITYLIWRIQYQKEKIRNIENQLSDKKYKLYSELLYILFDVQHRDKLGKPISQQELLERLLYIKKDMFLYAPDELFQLFKNWTLQLEKEPINQFKTYFEIIKLARKDMGYKKTKIKLDDFMLFYFQSEEEYSKFKHQHNW